MPFSDAWPETEDLRALANKLVDMLDDVRRDRRPIPSQVPEPLSLPKAGLGTEGLLGAWEQICDGSAQLGAPSMSGHMDTAPHPYAVLSQALVSAFNNNLLFRELSPFASRVEENLIDAFKEHLGLDEDWGGTWASGGSIANLTALFCAVGGYSERTARHRIRLYFPESGHASLSKAAAVLGLDPDQVIRVNCDNAGRMRPEALIKALSEMPGNAKAIVTSVLGSTIHGSVDCVEHIGQICRHYEAWHHVDAIYGAALMFSKDHRDLLAGLSTADTIVLGPQKWMYVPRVSAAVLVRNKARFESRLGVTMPYSISTESHRGQWGVQGSRPADALVLWAMLQAVGTDALGAEVDRSILLTRLFNERLSQSEVLTPTHSPDLNLQLIATRCDAALAQERLTEAGGVWASVSQWRDQSYLRMVLLSPNLDETRLDLFVSQLEDASR